MFGITECGLNWLIARCIIICITVGVFIYATLLSISSFLAAFGSGCALKTNYIVSTARVELIRIVFSLNISKCCNDIGNINDISLEASYDTNKSTFAVHNHTHNALICVLMVQSITDIISTSRDISNISSTTRGTYNIIGTWYNEYRLFVFYWHVKTHQIYKNTNIENISKHNLFSLQQYYNESIKHFHLNHWTLLLTYLIIYVYKYVVNTSHRHHFVQNELLKRFGQTFSVYFCV